MRGPTFEEFFSDEFGPLVAFLQKTGFEMEQAKDAASEAMTCACQRWSQIDRSPRGWVRRAAYRIASGQAGRAREDVRRAVAGDWTHSTHNDVDVVEIIEGYKLLVQALQQLPPRQRLVMAWYLDGFEAKEIADQLDMPQETVRSNLRHARNRLKEFYPGPPDGSDEGRK